MKTKLPIWLTSNQESEPEISNILIVLHFIAIASIIAILITNFINRVEFVFWVTFILGILVTTSLILAFWGYSAPGRFLVPLGLVTAIATLAADGSGMHDTAVVAFPAALIVGGLLVGRHGLWAITLLCIAAVTVIGIREMNGLVITPFKGQTGWDDILINYTILIAVATALNLVMKRMEDSVEQARKNISVPPRFIIHPTQ